MTLVSLLMNIFRNVNDKAFAEDIVSAMFNDLTKILIKYGSSNLENLDTDQICALLGDEMKNIDETLSQYGVITRPTMNGWKIGGFAKSVYGYGNVPLGECYETFRSRGECISAVFAILEDSRLKPAIEAAATRKLSTNAGLIDMLQALF